MLAHAASRQGEIVADVLAGESVAFDYRAVSAAVFTDPEIATVGLTEAEVEDRGFEPLVGEYPLDASGRALTLDEISGFVRIVATTDTERILGGQIVGPEASELIFEFVLAVKVGARVKDLVSTIHTHPISRRDAWSQQQTCAMRLFTSRIANRTLPWATFAGSVYRVSIVGGSVGGPTIPPACAAGPSRRRSSGTHRRTPPRGGICKRLRVL